jgi:hypothetical protein
MNPTWFASISHDPQPTFARVVRTALAMAALSLASIAVAAPQTHDLGDGLIYARVHAAATDLPSGEAVRGHPCVLDLRFAQGDAVAANLVASWLTTHVGTHSPIFILVNDATAEPLRQVLAGHPAGLLVIGIEGQSLTADVMVRQPAAEERQAYDAFDHGTSVTTLTTDNPDKQRNDEASLSHDRPSDVADRETASGDAATAKPAQPPLDAALQRAIQLHRALRAMKRL